MDGQIVSLVLGSGFTSGINLYLLVTSLGLAQKFGLVTLPGGMNELSNWWIIGVAGVLLVLEFCADKIPYVDTVWDLLHTIIRVLGGAGIAHLASSNTGMSEQVLMTLLGGGTALASHSTLTTARAAVNLSPEPISTWIVAAIEDVFVIICVLVTILAPIIIGIFALVFLLVFIVTLPFGIWLAIKIFKKIRSIFRKAIAFFRNGKSPVTAYSTR